MPKHLWVEIVVTPIDPILDANGHTLNIFASTAAIELAREEPVYGCAACSELLAVETLDSECIPVEIPSTPRRG